MNPNINYSIFNNFYHEPRPAFPAYAHSYESAYHDEHDPQEYTFLPKANFLDHFIGSPLDVTRQSTDATEAADMTPMSQKTISPNVYPYQKYNIQDYNSSFANLSVKPMDMVPNRFAEAGPYHTFKTAIEPQFFQNQLAQVCPPSHVIASSLIKVEEKPKQVQKFEEAEDEEMQEEHGQGQEVVLNTQLKSLMDSKLWSEEKDQMLLKLGTQYKCDWKKISKRFNNKKITPHFLKIRYKELTCAPLQRRVKFNHREDLMIAKYFEKYGSNWAQMAGHFQDRSAIMLKNRYYSFIRKRELLDGLLQEVREIEKNGQDVDTLKDQESERYYDMFTAQKGIYKDDSSDNESGTSAVMPQQVLPEAAVIQNLPKKGSPGVSVRSRKEDKGESRAKKGQEIEENKAIEFLKSRVKSLQSLYLTTKAELDKYKLKK